MSVKNKTFNVCYLREYMDPEHQGDYFYAYETVYRNVPEKFRKKFTNQKTKMKLIKFLDWNYKETASNFAKCTRIELIDEDQYYQTYEDVFGETASGDKNLFNDYGQKWDRQSLRKDFDMTKTKKHVREYNGRGIQ